MGDIGTERREVEFEPLPEESGTALGRDAAASPARPAVPASTGPDASRSRAGT
jgi:hypothetical protein